MNRSRAATAAGLERFCVPGLLHGTAIARVGPVRAADGFDGPAERLRHADGTTTTLPGVGLGAYSGDCVIAVLWHPVERRLTLVHAGWRGLAAGILGRTARLYADRRDVRVAIGPAIGPCHYEVGEEVVRAVEAGSPGGAVAERRRGRWVLDLVGSVEAALRAEGFRAVEATGVCTACEADRFYSFRRDGVTGRHLAVASVLGPEPSVAPVNEKQRVLPSVV
jgi:polyphenol oxidase